MTASPATPTTGAAGAAGAHALLDALTQLSAGGGARDGVALVRFTDVAASLRALPGATEMFGVKVASAVGWAAILFSSWRHRKYDWPDESGASRVRRFIAQDLDDARRLAPAR